MRIFTIIKSKSERLKHKNFLALGDKPLWRHLIDELSPCDVTINTDSAQILEEVSNLGRSSLRAVPRDQRHIEWEEDPTVLTSPVTDMLIDFCADLGEEIVVLTHVTSPFLKLETLRDAVEILKTKPSIRSVHSIDQVRDFGWLNRSDEVSPINFDENVVQRTQDLDPILVSKGAFFIARASDIVRTGIRLPPPVHYYALSKIEAIEIDTGEDFTFASIVNHGLEKS